MNKEWWRNWYKQYALKARSEIFKLLGDKCVQCGFDDKRALQVDHVFDDGYKHRKSYSSSYRMLKLIKANPERFQILCANHNWIKRHERNLLPKTEDLDSD